MITQYTDSYSSPSADIQNLVANNVRLLDKYILMQTGQNEYKALIYNTASKKCEEITISRNSSNYNNQYTVSRKEVETFDYTVTNEYYVYSNDGIGKSLTLPVYEGVTAHSTIIVCCALLFAIVFKGVLFKCVDRLRRR